VTRCGRTTPNLRATTEALENDLAVRSVNAFPTAAEDRAGLLEDRPWVKPYSIHTSQITARTPSPACWGRWREAPDGVWPAATTPDGLHERYRELAVQAPCFSHPIRRLRRHLPRFAEKQL
jgi:hypothetical protein